MQIIHIGQKNSTIFQEYFKYLIAMTVFSLGSSTIFLFEISGILLKRVDFLKFQNNLEH